MIMKNLATIVLSLTFTLSSFSQGVNVTASRTGISLKSLPGEMTSLQRGIVYQMVANPEDGSAMVVPTVGDEEGIVLQFIVTAEPNETILMTTVLPSMLFGNEVGGRIGCSFGSSSLMRMTTKELLNPYDSIIFVMNSAGSDTFYLGITVTVPASVYPDLYFNNIVCSVENLGTEETDVEAGFYEVEVPAIPLCVTAQDGNLERLSKNTIYYLSPATNILSPKISGNETGMSLTLNVSGEPYALVAIFFVLPSSLRGTTSLFCSFGSTSLYYIEGNSTANPNVASVFSLGAEGEIHLRLGITLSVPGNCNDGEYLGPVLSQVAYTGPEYFASLVKTQSSCNVTVANYIAHVGDADDVNDEQFTPLEFRLEQNFPNPFNPSTVIRYQLPVRSFVTLNVYNLLGQEMATLVNEMKQQGTYTVEWDASGFLSGVYFTRLVVADKTLTRKLVLIK